MHMLIVQHCTYHPRSDGALQKKEQAAQEDAPRCLFMEGTHASNTVQ